MPSKKSQKKLPSENSINPSESSSVKYYQWTIFVTLFIGYGFYAYNRKSVSLAMPELMKNGLQKSDAGLIVSSQNIAYAISKFIGGVLSDRLSSRLLFTSGLLLSGFATILFANSDSVLIYTGLWFLNGLAQGFGWPACAKVLRQWFSPQQFGTFWSLLSSSTNISGGVTPFITAYVIINYGWRTSLLIAGTTSLVVASVALITIVNCPQDVNLPAINPNSVNTKSGDKKKSSQKGSSWTDLLKSPFLWLVSLSYMSVFAAKTSAVDWGQMYLIEDRNHSQLIASSFTSSLETGGFFGGVLAGYLTDLVVRRQSTNKKSSQLAPSNARMPVAIAMLVGDVVCLHFFQFYITESTSQLTIASLGFITGACLYGPINIFGVVASESAPPHLSGTSHAIVALAANVGAITSGLPFSLLAKRYNWSAIFLLLEVLTFLTVIMLILCRNIPALIAKTTKQS